MEKRQLAQADTTRGSLRAGVAKSELSTRVQGMVVNDPLYAKALVLDDGKTKVVILAMDAVAIGGICDINDEFLSKLRGRIEDELGIDGGNVLVNASHTHTVGPMLCEDAEQLEKTFDAVKRAAGNMVPVTIGSGVGHEDRFIINRTLRLKDGQGWTIRQANPCPPDEDIAELGPIDPEIGILRVDRMDGQPLAVVYNFACHPLIGVPGGAVTANFPGFASEVIEADLGGDAMALFLQGAGGDVTEVLYKDVSHPKDSKSLGTMLGLSTLKALKGIETKAVDLAVASTTVELPRRTDIPERLAELEQEQARLLASLRGTSLNFKTFLPLYLKYELNPDYPADYAYRYMQEEARGVNHLTALDADNRRNLDKYRRNIDAMEKLARIQDQMGTLRKHKAENDEAGSPTATAEVLGIRLGDCVLVSAPVEMLVQVGLNVKGASPFEHTFVSPFSNGYYHYGAPASDYPMGGYEVTECLLAPEWQAIYEKAAAEVIGRLKADD